MKDKKAVALVADFETTVDTERSQVWSAAYIDLADECHPDNVHIDLNIDAFMNHMLYYSDDDVTVYFHNEKFDGTFILSWLKEHDSWTELSQDGELLPMKGATSRKLARECFDYAYTYCVSDLGQWYSITIIFNGKFITFKDSLKLLPFSVKQIGKNFKTKYQKLEMDYKGHDAPDQPLLPHEEDYIKNDVLVMHEAMNIMFGRGMTKSTIGSCCLSEFKKPYGKGLFRQIFPDLTKEECPIEGYENADDYIRKSYHGGWCYVKKGCENKLYHNGITCDVNSLYPSMMQSESGNEYPIGYPTWWTGEIPDKAYDGYFFVRIRTFFDLKEGYLPTLQIKGSTWYKSNEWLETSRVNGERYGYDIDGKYVEIKPILTLTMTDFFLLLEHYDLDELEILDGCYFDKTIGLFDEYIDYWSQLKINATNPVDRQLAKLMLNNLYGKFSSSDDSSYKIFDYEDGHLHARTVEAHEKESGYIPIGSAITSYARNFTITAAQANYDSFVYADTDSIHCHDVTADDIKGAPRHETAFNHWKYEASWDDAIFVRQKTYVEHVTEENLEAIDEPYYNIKCAGMGEGPRQNLTKWLNDGYKKVSEGDEVYITPFGLTDFKVGLAVEGNLKAKIVSGGTVLVENIYKMR